MDDIMEIVKSFEESGLIGIGKQLKMKQKHKWMDFLVCCYEHEVLFFQDICQQAKELSEKMKEQLE